MGNTTTLNEALRSPVDYSESVRLATPGANWKAPLSSFVRKRLLSSASFFVDNVAGSDSNPGTAGLPFGTLQFAWNFLSASIDANAHDITINCVASATPYLLDAENGWIGGNNVNIHGAGSGTTTIQDLAFGANSTFNLGAQINVDKFTLTESVSAFNCLMSALGTVNLSSRGGDVVIGSTVSQFQGVAAYNFGCEVALYDVKFNGFNGASATPLFAGFGGTLLIRGSSTLSVVGNPTLGIFAQATDLGELVANSSITGTAVCKRYESDNNAVIQTNGGGPNFFPGNVAGTTSNGGQYV